MANLKEIRLHIASVKSMQQITSAMKMVSAAKLRRAQDAIIHFRPFAAKLYEILATISSHLDGSVINKYAERKEVKKILLIAVTSNRGLCGGFNANVTRKVIDLLNDNYSEYYQKGKLKEAEYIYKMILKKQPTNIQVPMQPN